MAEGYSYLLSAIKQLDTGAGFADIADNYNYSGTAAAELQLKNIPTSWYGHKYRCMVDGNAGRIYQLQFITSFTGNAGTAWEIPANWSCGVVPDYNTDVAISIANTIVNSNGVCRSIQIKSPAIVTVNAGSILTVTH